MFKLGLKTCPSVIAEVSGDAISANFTCHIYVSYGGGLAQLFDSVPHGH